MNKNVSFSTLKNTVIPKTDLMGMNDAFLRNKHVTKVISKPRYILNAKIREIDFLDSSILIE